MGQKPGFSKEAGLLRRRLSWCPIMKQMLTTRRRVIVVFGAGGDRDIEKRPLMGQAASTADICVVTSDNPRSEDPDRIIEQIVAGIPAHTKTHIEVDRETAIAWAIRHAKPTDTLAPWNALSVSPLAIVASKR